MIIVAASLRPACLPVRRHAMLCQAHLMTQSKAEVLLKKSNFVAAQDLFSMTTSTTARFYTTSRIFGGLT
jgi:hypothetical protein